MSEAAIEDVVQKRVARVVVVLGVALEALQLEQKMRQQLDALDGILAGAHDRLGLTRERRELVEILVDVEIRVLLFRDQQRAARQWHRLFGRKRRKFPSCIVHRVNTVRNSVALRRML